MQYYTNCVSAISSLFTFSYSLHNFLFNRQNIYFTLFLHLNTTAYIISVHYHLNQTAYLLTTGILKIFIQVLKCNFEIGFRRFTGNSGGCTGSDWRPSRQHYKYLNVDRGPDSVTGMAGPKVDGSAVSIIYGGC